MVQRIADLIGDFVLLPPLDFAAGPGVRQMIPANPTRWLWQLIYSGSGNIQISTSPSPPAAAAKLNPTASLFAFNFRDHTLLAVADWYFTMVTAGDFLHVEQVEYRPGGHAASLEQMVALAARLRGEHAAQR